MELKQVDINFASYQYTIEDTGIRLIKKRLASSSDTFVDFEDVGSKTIKESTRKIIFVFIVAPNLGQNNMSNNRLAGIA